MTIDTGNMCVKPCFCANLSSPVPPDVNCRHPRGGHEKGHWCVVVRFSRVLEPAVAATIWKRFILGIPCKERRPPAGGCEPENSPRQHEDLLASSNRRPFESSRLVS